MAESEISELDSTAPNKVCDDPMALAADADQTIQPVTQVVKIPSKKILNLMLDKLDLPRAKYTFHEADDCQVYATVAFYISTHRPGDMLRQVVMEGVLSIDIEIAEESVALEGIRYMENLENIIIEDLSFSELCYLKEQNKDLQDKLKAAEQRNQEQRAGLHLTLLDMTAISHRLYALTDRYRSIRQGDAGNQNNAVLEQFDAVTFDLQRSSARLTKFL